MSSVFLTDSESPGKMRISLRRAPDDNKRFSPEMQKNFQQVIASLRKEGIEVSPTVFTMDAVGASGGLTGEFVVGLKAFGPPAIAALAGWFAARANRKVRIKVGEVEVEAQDEKQLKRLLDEAMTLALKTKQGNADECRPSKRTPDVS